MANSKRAVSALGALLGVFLAGGGRAHADCASPANAIEAENCLPGSPPSEWDVNGAGDASIQGFATDMSVNRGTTIQFKVKTPASSYRLDIYRIGYYGGNGARKVATVTPSATLPQSQPNCLTNSTGLVDCGNWAVSASWAVPATAVSGVYVAHLVRNDNGDASHIIFVVRRDGAPSDILFQTGDTTWQAYNRYGGNSLYQGSGPGGGGRAYKVSYNRPFTTRGDSVADSFFNAEYPMVRWLERNGYDVSYFSGVDADRLGPEIALRKVYLSVGHDEYWSKQQRLNVEAARDGTLPGQTAPVHLAFLSGNSVFWKTRWESSISSPATAHRTLVCYKETHEGAKIDPSPEWTGTWRDARSFNPQGPNPENALMGTLFTVNCCSYPLEVRLPEAQLRFWRNTPNISQLTGTQLWTGPPETLGYEWDEDLDNGARPAGLVRLSITGRSVPERLLDYGSTYGPGSAVHSLAFYKRPNGALVFGSGTIQWSWGLDSNHDRGNEAAQPGHAAGDGQPLRRHGRPARHPRRRPRARVPLHRRPGRDLADHVPRQQRHASGRTGGQHPGHGDGCGAGTRGRRRGVAGRRADVASRHGPGHLVLRVDAHPERNGHPPLARRRRQRQPRGAWSRTHGHHRVGTPAPGGRRQHLGRHRHARSHQPGRRARDRRGREVPLVAGGPDHRPALLQGRPGHRHPHRPAVDLVRSAARGRDVRRRDGGRAGRRSSSRPRCRSPPTPRTSPRCTPRSVSTW